MKNYSPRQTDINLRPCHHTCRDGSTADKKEKMKTLENGCNRLFSRAYFAFLRAIQVKDFVCVLRDVRVKNEFYSPL